VKYSQSRIRSRASTKGCSIQVDARTGLTHSFTTTSANEHDLNQASRLLHGEDHFIFADAGYRGADKRSELQDVS